MKKLMIGLAMMLGSATAANATVLTFDGNICNDGQACGNFGFIDQSYGDSADVDVQYNRDVTGQSGPDQRLSFWDSAYSDLTNVAWGGADSATGTTQIFLKPLGGGNVTLLGFDLGAWPFAALATQVKIVDGLNNVLFASGPIIVGKGGTHSHFAFNLSSSTGIGIRFGPDGFNVGIDNVDFASGIVSAIPEPVSWTLILLGFGCVGTVARRSKNMKLPGVVLARI